jgi:hypothetical protein
MASIDKLALTCRLLYDQRVLEQRKEIEMLEVKYFFRGYTYEIFNKALKDLNWMNVRCKCRGCKATGRIYFFDIVDEAAACTFGPWFDNVLHERGLVVLRKDEWGEINSNGPDDNLSDQFRIPDFSDDDCHLVESPNDELEDDVRWGLIYIGKRLWAVESINNQWIKEFERVFSGYGYHRERISSPPTPPPSPKMAPPQSQPLPITTIINQGLELQELKKQLATQGLELQELKKQLATQTLKEQHVCDDTRIRP